MSMYIIHDLEDMVVTPPPPGSSMLLPGMSHFIAQNMELHEAQAATLAAQRSA